MTFELRLPFDDPVPAAPAPVPSPVAAPAAPDKPAAPASLTDAAARAAATDPSQNVVLEASAGTGKTRVLVERYVNLLRAGVEPEHILAVTFTRKAAAEMRQRIIDRLKEASRLSEFDRARWNSLRTRLGDIAISTIDAFCLSLLREFPLEADVDPGFELAADAEVPRLMEEALDAAFRIGRAVAAEDDDVALLFAQLGERRLRSGIAALLDRRLAAPRVLRRFLAAGPKDLTAETACRHAAERLRDIFTSVAHRDTRGPRDLGGPRRRPNPPDLPDLPDLPDPHDLPDPLDLFLHDGPVHHPQFGMLADDLTRLIRSFVEGSGPPLGRRSDQAAFRSFIDRLRAYFLKQDGDPRGKHFAGTGFGAADCRTEDAWKRHRQTASAMAPLVADAVRAFRRDLNVVMSRGVWRIFAIALEQYERTLDSRGLLDFPGVLERAVKLLKDLDEFAGSRLRLEARHRHVLLDEFQDTNRAQWELILQLVKTWGEGMGAADDALPPSIFIVGDRKQSIYGFRDADAALIDDAAGFIEGLRPASRPRQAITVSFRSAPGILTFVNDLFRLIAGAAAGPARRDGFRYDEHDWFPVDRRDEPCSPIGVLVGDTVRQSAERVAHEIVELLSNAVVRDRATGVPRQARPADVAILFRSRDSHRDFESALAARGVATYVYKGLGFFDSDEVQDAVALLRYLADPLSDLRASSLLRSRFVRLSDGAVTALSPRIAGAILEEAWPESASAFDAEDRRVFQLLRSAVPRWLDRVDRQAPSDVLDAILRETAYAYELRGTRWRQARENMKKFRGMIRRAQNRGYATLARLADYLERLAVGDESNASIDATDAVSLMTVHAAKGLEFPIVFVVNMGRGTGGIRPPIRVAGDGAADASVAIADYQSEADEDASAREREETKRLLYVALTRARDRLYLSAVVQEGKFRAGRGSLGEVLPDEVKALFVEAASREQPAAEPRHVAAPARETTRLDDFDSLNE